MSKPAANQKPSFWQNALLIVTIFLGVQLFFGSRNQPQDTSTADQLYQRMLAQNAKLQDVTIAQTAAEYGKHLDDLVSKKQMTQADADSKKIEATILVADTELKDGLYRNDTGRIRSAYQRLVPFEKRQIDTPAWTKTYSVPHTMIPKPAVDERGVPIEGSVTKFDWTEWSGQSLYGVVVQRLSERNKSDYVYGIVPGYQLIDFLVRATGSNPNFSYAFAAFLLALVVRSIVFPLAQKQLMFSRQMSQLVPLTNEIKAKYKSDQAMQQQKVMELYREYGINPLAGCLPMLIQMPLFLTIYQCMVRYQFEFQKGVFLWINPTTSKATHGFVAPNLGQQDYILTIIYGITMIIATLLTPVTDPTQVKQQRWMGVGISVLFTVFMFTGALPVVSGFVLYWTFTNLLTTAQSLRAYRLPMPPLVKVSARTGGALPKPTSRWQQMMDRMMEEQQRQQGLKNGTIPLPDDLKPVDDNKQSNSGGNGKSAFELQSGPVKTGKPATHKPKRRK